MCLSSGRGWTVIPSAPNCWHFTAASVTLGMVPPLLFRSVAILFIFTLNRAIFTFY
jgi:hypothetical protein